MSNTPHALSENLVLYNSSHFENTAKVLPPTPSVPNGKVVVHIGEPRSAAGFVSRDLLDASENFATSATATYVPYPLNGTTQFNATDNQIIRLQDGSLLASKNGYLTSNLTPSPAWFGTTNVTFSSATSVTSKQARNCVFIFRSTNAGASWTLLSTIDAAVVEGGKYGWPQPSSDGTSFGIGGFDRTELYQDPWTGHIFVTGHGDGGPITLKGKTTSNHAGVIFRSVDNGASWQTFHVFSDSANQSKGAAPYEMTSTPDHELIVFHVVNSTPTMHYVESGVMSDAKTIVASDGTNALAWGVAANEADVRGSQPCIARIGRVGTGANVRDSVLVAYPSLNASSHQTYVIAAVTFGGTSAVVVDLVANVTATQPTKASAIMGAFIENDQVQPEGTGDEPVMLFYWIDAPPSTDPAAANGLTARYQVFYGAGGSFPAGTLSVASGVKRTFGRVGIGDYFSGGYFWLDDKLNFLCQWNEPDGIKANIVSLLPIPKRHNIFQAAIDPLSLILSNEAYVRLTLPDPPPPEVLREAVAEYARNLSVAQRRAMVANLARIETYAKAAGAAINATTVGKTAK